jgi:hypothetical protein
VDFYNLFQSNQPASVLMNEFYRIICIICTCIELYGPVRCNVTSKKIAASQIPFSIRRLLRPKAVAWRVHRACKTSESLISYKKAASSCKSAIYALMLKYEIQLITNANIGSFYRYANSRLNSKSAVGP